jgi:hypothetical protein
LSQVAVARSNDPIEPMDLANVRENGVRSLAVQCHQCWHRVIVNADHWPGDLTVKSLEPRMVCTKRLAVDHSRSSRSRFEPGVGWCAGQRLEDIGHRAADGLAFRHRPGVGLVLARAIAMNRSWVMT